MTTKLNYLDAEEIEGWLKDRLDDEAAGEFLGPDSTCWEINPTLAARHIVSSLEQEGLAILPTEDMWPSILTFRLGDPVEYSTCGGFSCHKIAATVVGWFRHTSGAKAGGYGYVLQYGHTTQVVDAGRVGALREGKS